MQAGCSLWQSPTLVLPLPSCEKSRVTYLLLLLLPPFSPSLSLSLSPLAHPTPLILQCPSQYLTIPQCLPFPSYLPLSSFTFAIFFLLSIVVCFLMCDPTFNANATANGGFVFTGLAKGYQTEQKNKRRRHRYGPRADSIPGTAGACANHMRRPQDPGVVPPHPLPATYCRCVVSQERCGGRGAEQQRQKRINNERQRL